MSWLKKLWRGEARFWQAFWLGAAVVFFSTLALALYLGESIQTGAISFSDFYDIRAYFQVGVLAFCAIWLTMITRGMDRAKLKWSAWLGVVVVIYLIGTSTFSVALYFLRDGDAPAVFMQEGEGV